MSLPLSLPLPKNNFHRIQNAGADGENTNFLFINN